MIGRSGSVALGADDTEQEHEQPLLYVCQTPDGRHDDGDVTIALALSRWRPGAPAQTGR